MQPGILPIVSVPSTATAPTPFPAAAALGRTGTRKEGFSQPSGTRPSLHDDERFHATAVAF